MKNIVVFEQAKGLIELVIGIKKEIEKGDKEVIWKGDICFTKFNQRYKTDTKLQSKLNSNLEQLDKLISIVRKDLYESKLISITDITSMNTLHNAFNTNKKSDVDKLCIFIESGMMQVLYNKLSSIIDIYNMCIREIKE